MKVDQLLFGYRDGHRLLAASSQMPTAVIATLLGATDAAVSEGSGRLVTGMPLPEVGGYALCVTWSAPELERPGAVWSHALVFDAGVLAELSDPSAILQMAQRPTPPDLAGYEHALQPSQLDVAAFEDPPLDVLTDVVLATYGTTGERALIYANLRTAESALFAIWRAQWPDLRARFSFRTRDALRLSSEPAADVVVARRARGMQQKKPQSSEREALWIKALTEAIRSPRHGQLARFIAEFGPRDRAEPSTVASVAQIYEAIALNAVDGVRARVEARYPRQSLGRDMKRILFGRTENVWWEVGEAPRVSALLAAEKDAWDPLELDVSARIVEVLANRSAASLAATLADNGPRSMYEALLSALVVTGKPRQVAPVASARLDLAADWLSAAPQIARRPNTWRRMTDEIARALLAQVGPQDSETIVAAIEAMRRDDVVAVVGVDRALSAVAEAKNLVAARTLLEPIPEKDALLLANQSEDAAVLLVLTAIGSPIDPTRVLAALERTREQDDEVWLRSAVRLLVDRTPSTSECLEVVFGPVYAALEKQKIPADSWGQLAEILPDGPTRARRLGRLLLSTARYENWSEERLARALRDAGPGAERLLRDLDRDDPLTRLVGMLVGAVRRLTR